MLKCARLAERRTTNLEVQTKAVHDEGNKTAKMICADLNLFGAPPPPPPPPKAEAECGIAGGGGGGAMAAAAEAKAAEVDFLLRILSLALELCQTHTDSSGSSPRTEHQEPRREFG